MQDNYTLTSSNDYYTVVELTGTATPAETVNSVFNAMNIGNGVGILSGKTGHNLLFKSLVAGTNITLQSTASGVTINSTGGGGGSGFPESITVDTTVKGANAHSLNFGEVGGEELFAFNVRTNDYSEWTTGENGILAIYSTNIEPANGGGLIQVFPYGLNFGGGYANAGSLQLTNNGFLGVANAGEASISAYSVPIKLNGYSPSAEKTSLVLTPTNTTPTLVIDSDGSGFKGLQYGKDFNSNFELRSLVDKGFVTGNTASKNYVTGITSTLQTKSGFNSYTASTYGSYSYFKTGNYYAIHCPVAGNIIAASSFSANNLRSYPFVLTEDFSFNEILITLGSQNVSSMRIGIYTDLAGEPDQLIANTDAGIYDGNAGVGGTNVSITPAAVVTLPRGKYHLVYTCSGTPSVRSISTTALSTPLLGVTVPIGLNMASFVAGRTVARTFQALPTTFPAGSTAVTGSINVPYVVFKKA